MHKSLRFPIALLALHVCRFAYGHGLPVKLDIDEGVIQVLGGIEDPAGYARMLFYDGSEDAQLDHLRLPNGTRVALTNLPGFNINGMAPDSGLYLDVVPRPDYSQPTPAQRWLWYWGNPDDKVALAPDDVSLTMASETGDLILYQDEPPSSQSLRVANPLSDELGEHVHFLRYLLDDDPTAAQGVYGFFAQLSSPSYATSEPILVLLNNGLSAAWVAQAGQDINSAAVLPGDFNDDGQLTVNDIDLLSAGIRAAAGDLQFDLDASGGVDDQDLATWIVELKHTWFGDADLNGQFNSDDLVAALASGEYEDTVPGNSTWGSGDWNADGDFDSNDLVAALADGGYQQGPRAAVSAVPEPPSQSFLALAAAVLLCRRRPRLISASLE